MPLMGSIETMQNSKNISLLHLLHFPQAHQNVQPGKFSVVTSHTFDTDTNTANIPTNRL